MGFAPTRFFTIDVADFHLSVDHVKALGGAVAFTAWICFGGPRVVSRSIPTEPNRVVGTCIRGAKPITDDVLFQTTFLFAADVLTLPVKDLDRAARGTLGRSVSARSTDASLLTRPSSSSAMEVVAFDALGIEGQHRRLRVNPRATRDSRR